MIEPVARIRIELQDLEPKIWRRVDVPLSSTLAALNDIRAPLRIGELSEDIV